MTEFTTNWVTKEAESWSEFLAEFVGQPNIRALEIGSFEGRSACWFLDHVLTGDGAVLDCVDSWAGDSVELGDAAIAAETRFNRNTAKYQERIRKHKSHSFKWLLRRNESAGSSLYDFIYIDGGHDASCVLNDLTLSWPLLRAGGILICDDYRWTHPGIARPPRVAIDAFFSCRSDWKLIHAARQFIVRKCISDGERESK